MIEKKNKQQLNLKQMDGNNNKKKNQTPEFL